MTKSITKSSAPINIAFTKFCAFSTTQTGKKHLMQIWGLMHTYVGSKGKLF